ncbi:MAG: 7-cyano-7-deazaguanine synthase QueC [Alphaproteobacteria bacterium]|nr:7-cyano-7-deazaguanine synthase QueC [Alphaproteobacteria bacterium]
MSHTAVTVTPSTRTKAIVLVSGGLDSATTLAIANHQGYDLYALSFQYGQRHAVELEFAGKVIKAQAGVIEHRIATIDLGLFGGSALTDLDIHVPKNQEIGTIGHIPITYVPARNTVFLSYALAYAEVIGAHDIFIGVNAVDYSGYPDCRPAFIEAFQTLANLATKAGVEQSNFHIHAPLIQKTKSEIIQLGLQLGVNYANTLSCYDPLPDGIACGTCDSCTLRLQGFNDAGISDPALYHHHHHHHHLT